MSPDLEDLWRKSCAKSPEWEGQLELDFKEEEGNVASHQVAHCGFCFATSSHQPMSLKCALQDRSGMFQDNTVLLPNCGSHS